MFNPENIFNRDGSFVWWLGVVEDRKEDPDRLGRVRVRIWGYHSDDKEVLPTEELPWAIVMQPTTSAAVSGMGTSPTFLLEGTWVFGFFIDGNDKQQPVIIGTVGGYTQKVPRCGQESNYLSIEQETDIEFERAEAVLYPEFEGDLASGAVSYDESLNPGSDASFPALNEWIENETEAFQDPNGEFPRCNYVDKPDTNKLATGDVFELEDTIFTFKLNAREGEGPPLGGTFTDAGVPEDATRNEVDITLEIPTAFEGEPWDEPEPAWCTIYPYNKVFETESGHVVEYDDTEGHERIQIYHRTGTYIEIDQNGSVTRRTMGDSYNLIEKNSYTRIGKDATITIAAPQREEGAGVTEDYPTRLKIFVEEGSAEVEVMGDVRMKVHENMQMEVLKDFHLKARNITMEVADEEGERGKFSLTAGEIHTDTEENHVHKVGGEWGLTATGEIREQGSAIRMNGLAPAESDPDPFAEIEPEEITIPLEREDCILEELEWPEDPEEEIEIVEAPAFPAEFEADFVLPPIAEAAEASPFGAGSITTINTEDISGLTIAPAATRISQTFSLGDLINVNVPAVAAAAGLETGDFLVNLRELTVNTIEPIAAQYPGTVVVGSNNVPADEGFAVARSQGRAVSLQFTQNSMADVPAIATWITNNVPYSQVQLQHFVSPVTGQVRTAIGVALGSTTVASPVMTTFNGIPLGAGIIPYSGV